jgi:hypothetical protein
VEFGDTSCHCCLSTPVYLIENAAENRVRIISQKER